MTVAQPGESTNKGKPQPPPIKPDPDLYVDILGGDKSPLKPRLAELSMYAKGIDNLEKSGIVNIKGLGDMAKTIPWGQYIESGDIVVLIRKGRVVAVRIEALRKL